MCRNLGMQMSTFHPTCCTLSLAAKNFIQFTLYYRQIWRFMCIITVKHCSLNTATLSTSVPSLLVLSLELSQVLFNMLIEYLIISALLNNMHSIDSTMNYSMHARALEWIRLRTIDNISIVLKETMQAFTHIALHYI